MTLSLEDRQLIVDAVNKYALGYDEANFVLLADAFCKDATSGGKISNTDAYWGPMIGRDQIVSGLKDMRMAPHQPRHCITNVFFRSHNQEETVLSAYLTLMGSDSAARILSVGRLDIAANKEDGVWRIRKLDVTLDAPF